MLFKAKVILKNVALTVIAVLFIYIPEGVLFIHIGTHDEVY